MTYDANGNLIGDGANTYTWDARNRLGSIIGASFQYDPFGRRQSRTVGSTATKFLYDGLNRVQELNGSTVTANLLTGLNVDEVLTRTDSTGARNFLSDALGSTLALTDSTGAVQTQYTFEPFGNTTGSGQANANPIEYTGRENEGNGLYYYRARYYNPTIGRFISEDPMGFRGGINVYAYVGNNLLAGSTPSGWTG